MIYKNELSDVELSQGKGSNNSNSFSNFNDASELFNVKIETYMVSMPKVNEKTGKNYPTPIFRILPSFDMDLYGSGGEEFKMSALPYRYTGYAADGSPVPLFTNWVSKMYVYKYFGSNKVKFVSPLTLVQGWENKGRGYPPRGVDPVVDLRNFIAFNSSNWSGSQTHVAEKFVGMIKRTGNRNSPYVPSKPSTVYFMNAVKRMPDDENSKWTNCIVIVSAQAFYDLVKLMNVKTGVDDNGKPEIGLSPDKFPRYLFGDITDLKTGPVFEVGSSVDDKTGFATGALVLQGKNDIETTRGVKFAELNNDYLKHREVLMDTDIFKVKTYAEIVDIMLNDPQYFPYELIKLCSDNGGFRGYRIPSERVEISENQEQKETSKNNVDFLPEEKEIEDVDDDFSKAVSESKETNSVQSEDDALLKEFKSLDQRITDGDASVGMDGFRRWSELKKMFSK